MLIIMVFYYGIYRPVQSTRNANNNKAVHFFFTVLVLQLFSPGNREKERDREREGEIERERGRRPIKSVSTPDGPGPSI